MSWKEAEKTLLKNRKAIVVIAVALLIFVIASSSLSQPLSSRMLGIVTPGWEIYNHITAMQFAEGVKSSASEFTTPRDISAVYWKVDPDDPNYGVPTIMVQTSDIRHVNFAGQVTPTNQPADTRTVERGDHKYQLDYHIYMFDITIRTVADRVQIGTSGPLPGILQYPVWEHETSWAEMSSNPHSFPSSRVGKQWNGGVYVKFVISPWKGYYEGETPKDYVLKNAWAGTMNSYIFMKDQGQVQNQWGATPEASTEAQKFVKGALDNGAQIPMFADDGTYGKASERTNWGPDATPDSRIHSTVVLYLPVQEMAGAYLTRDWTGEITDLAPVDVYVKYTLRVDVLQTKDFVLQTAAKPPELDIPTDYFSWTKSFWEKPETLATIWILLMIGVGIVVFWIWTKRGQKR